MGHKNGHLDRLARPNWSKRAVGLVVAGLFLSLIWFNAGSERQLRKTYDDLSQKAAKSAASAAPDLAGDERPDVDTQPHNVTIPTQNIFSPPPFPDLPPPDNEEYMAICMAG